MLRIIPIKYREWVVVEARKWYKIWSNWGIIALGFLPDLYELIVTGLLSFPQIYDWLVASGTYDELPPALKWTARTLMVATLIVRHIKQKNLEGLRPQAIDNGY